MRRFLLGLALVCPLSGVDAQMTLPIETGAQRISRPVMSFLEMRERNLVRQGWDISCGAAALSTVLTYHFGAPYSEATIAVSILRNTDPARVRERGGFSLLDLKRFAEAVGYSADGYANLTLEDLNEANVPAILPVRIQNLDHCEQKNRDSSKKHARPEWMQRNELEHAFDQKGFELGPACALLPKRLGGALDGGGRWCGPIFAWRAHQTPSGYGRGSPSRKQEPCSVRPKGHCPGPHVFP